MVQNVRKVSAITKVLRMNKNDTKKCTILEKHSEVKNI